ncbi:MAG TPA: hypothetical protein VFA79_17385, partial [Myxococcales bacterium]|nr:hypothetical protein [Myxococcales bacterium]
MTDRVRIIEHGIVLLDFSGVAEAEAERHRAEEARKLISTQPLGQALVLTDVSGSTFDQRTIEDLRKLVEANRPYVKASALVGLSALTRVIFRALMTLTGREIKAFETRAQAIEYLIS